MNIVSNTYKITSRIIAENGNFPNNNTLPVLLYQGVLKLPLFFPSLFMERLFKSNNWSNVWHSGIYEYPHYHSITHEVMGVYKGETKLQLGGNNRIILELHKGDVLIIPAGVAHRNLQNEKDIKCVGAYPEGKDYDMKYGKSAELEVAFRNIEKVPMPLKDPVFGLSGGLIKYWI